MRFTFPYCVNPWVLTQPWGVYDLRYKPFGFTNHNGVDVALGADKTVYAPFSGTVLRACTKENGLWQPQGGGVFVSILSDTAFDFDDGQSCFVFADFLHCDHLLVKEGDHVSVGQALAIADNTGFSTGPHTHIQLRRETKQPLPAPAGVPSYRVDTDFWLSDVDVNNANDSFDPAPYYTKNYVVPAEDEAKKTLLLKIISLYQQLISFYKGRNKQNP